MGHVVATEPSLVERLTLAQRHASQGLARALAEDGVTVDQWRVLRVLADGEGHRMGRLATALVVAQATLTRLVDSLSDQALVYRRQSDVDGRRVTVHLSRQGQARLVRLDALVRAHERSLAADPEWQDLLAGIGASAGTV
jgi:DNA-binding MarR family transcriptional regulator